MDRSKGAYDRGALNSTSVEIRRLDGTFNVMSAEVRTGVKPRVGRRGGSGTTRGAVLDAARARFASDGFAGTTIRGVAADAGVDPSQVMQFFGSKDDLFAAVIAIPGGALERFATVFEGPDEHLGERVVRAYLQAWEDVPEESEPLMAMLRSAVVNDQANAQLRDFIQSRLLHGMRSRGPEAMFRAGLVAAMLVGVVTGRRIIGVPVLVAADHDALAATLGPVIQQLLVDETPAQVQRARCSP